MEALLKLLQYIDQLPLEKPEGTKVFYVLCSVHLRLVETVHFLRSSVCDEMCIPRVWRKDPSEKNNHMSWVPFWCWTLFMQYTCNNWNIQFFIWKHVNNSSLIRPTVQLKSKLTLKTRTSSSLARCLKRSRIESRVSSLEDQVQRIEKQGFLKYAKTWKGFEEMIYFSQEE